MNMLTNPLLCRLLVELLVIGELTQVTYHEVCSHLDTFSEAELEQIHAAVAVAELDSGFDRRLLAHLPATAQYAPN